MKPGIHSMRNSDYHGGPGLSSSDLKELLKSPAHWRAYKAAPPEATAEMLFGTLVHALILEPETFETEFAVGAFNIRRGKEYDRCLADNPGKTVVSESELEDAMAVVQAFKLELAENEDLRRLMTGAKEQVFAWEDPATGVLCKARPDIVTPFGAIVDIKTCRDAGFDAFQRAMVDLQYFVSAAHYLRGVNAVGACPMVPMLPTQFFFVAIEKKMPYSVRVFELNGEAMAFGNQLIDKALGVYAEAVATDTWAGYSREVLQLGIPPYALWKYNHSGSGR